LNCVVTLPHYKSGTNDGKDVGTTAGHEMMAEMKAWQKEIKADREATEAYPDRR
jgi:hypothetical protein